MCKVTLSSGKVLEFQTEEAAREFQEDIEREHFDEVESVEVTDEDSDPTPYCNACGAKRAKHCKCGPIAEND